VMETVKKPGRPPLKLWRSRLRWPELRGIVRRANGPTQLISHFNLTMPAKPKTHATRLTACPFLPALAGTTPCVRMPLPGESWNAGADPAFVRH